MSKAALAAQGEKNTHNHKDPHISKLKQEHMQENTRTVTRAQRLTLLRRDSPGEIMMTSSPGSTKAIMMAYRDSELPTPMVISLSQSSSRPRALE